MMKELDPNLARQAIELSRRHPTDVAVYYRDHQYQPPRPGVCLNSQREYGVLAEILAVYRDGQQLTGQKLL